MKEYMNAIETNPKQGKGFKKMSDGEYYGEFNKEHQRHGRGMMKYTIGDFYIGQWANDEINGSGTFIPSKNNPAGQFYSGEWKNGKSNGHGIILWKNGDIYKGGNLAN